MHHRDTAQFANPAKGRVKLIVVNHQRAFVGKEVFEGRDATIFDDGFNIVKHLFAPPRHGHMEGIITVRAGRLVVPHHQCIVQALTR